MSRILPAHSLVVALGAVQVLGAMIWGGCSGGEAFHTAGAGEDGAVGAASGGATASTGGTAAPGSGGTPATGGASVSPGSGGSSGRTATGGSPATGGAAATGGRTGSGGGVAQATGAILLVDDFEDGNTVGWIQDPADVEGKWSVATEGTTKALQQSVVTGAISWMVGGHLDWSNQRVEAKIKFTSFTDSGAMIFLASRFVDFDHYYFVYLKADGSMKIRKRISGSTTDLIPSYKTGLTIAAGATHTIGMSIAGATVTMYLDGVAVASATDVGATLAAGGIALGAQKVAASFDDVKVTVP